MASGKHAASKKEIFGFGREERKNDFNYDNTNIENKDENYDTKSSVYLTNAEYGYDDSMYSSNDYFDNEENNYKKIGIIVAVIAVMIAIGIAVYLIFFNEKTENNTTNETNTNKVAQNMITTLEGYDVLGKIKIESLNIEQYILDSTEAGALKEGVGRIDNGASMNNYGNFCIAGHNEDEIFGKLSELSVGDEFVLVDTDSIETTYKITKIYSVEPDNLECLLQDETKVETTLITCENGTTTRMIVKAEEKIDN